MGEEGKYSDLAASKTVIVYLWKRKPLTIIAKGYILDTTWIPYPPLKFFINFIYLLEKIFEKNGIKNNICFLPVQ